MHSCENRVCELLNPCLSQLLRYQDVLNRISKVEEWFFDSLKDFDILKDFDKSKSFPLDFLGWSREHAVYQLPNLEFVQELTKVIKKIDPEIILEVGAGRGTISKHISKIIDKEIILTDNYSWWTNGKQELLKDKIENLDIIKMDYSEAIKKYKPDLIIASWIPYKKSWTKDFRRCCYVKGYILIGESKGGCTGVDSDWITKWKINYLDDVEKYGICRSDHRLRQDDILHFSHTRVAYFERCGEYFEGQP